MSKRSPGTLPPALTAASFQDGEWVNEVKLYQRLFGLLNKTRQATAVLQQVWKAHQVSPISLPNGTWTTVPMAATDVDTGGWGINAAGGWTIPATGVYLVSGAAEFTGNTATNRRLVSIALDGATTSDTRTDEAPSASGVCIAINAALLVANAGQSLALWQYQDSGTTLSASGLGNGMRGSITAWRVA